MSDPIASQPSVHSVDVADMRTGTTRTKLYSMLDVFPSKEELRSMDHDASQAAWALLDMAAHMDARMSKLEFDVLEYIAGILPNLNANREMFEQTRQQAEAWSMEADAIEKRIEALVARIPNDEARIAVLRLLSILCVVDGLDTNEIDFIYLVGNKMKGDGYETADDILRAVWSAIS